MEKRTKILIGILIIAIVFLLGSVLISKKSSFLPKPFEKKPSKEEVKKEEIIKVPIPVKVKTEEEK